MNSPDITSSPFKGLVPFTEADRQYFFGREELSEVVINNLQAWRLTLLFGASGVGKSSVLSAGVLPRLEEMPDVAVVLFRDWQLADLLSSLKEKLREAVAKKVEVDITKELAFPEFLAECRRAMNGQIVFIFDQFEEYFSYHKDEEGPGTFADELKRAVIRPNMRINFLISIREDAVAKLDHFKNRVPDLFDHLLRIRPLKVSEARAAIVEPINCHNRLFAGNEISIEPELVNAVLDQVKTRDTVVQGASAGAAADQVDATILQLVMSRLWTEEMRRGSRALRLQTYDELGGAENILRTQWSSLLLTLSTSDQDVAAGVLRYLVTSSGTRIALNAVDLASYSEQSTAQVTAVLEELCGAKMRVLRRLAALPNQVDSAPRYEIFHEVFASSILDWLRRREQEEFMQQAAVAAAHQRTLDRARYARRAAVAMAALLIFTTTIAAYAWGKRKEVAAAYGELAKTNSKLEEKNVELQNSERALAENNVTLSTKNQELDLSNRKLKEQKKLSDELAIEALKQRHAALVATARAKSEKAKAVDARERAEVAYRQVFIEVEERKKAQDYAQEQARRAEDREKFAKEQFEKAEEQRKIADEARAKETTAVENQTEALDSLQKADVAPDYSHNIIRGPKEPVSRFTLPNDQSSIIVSTDSGVDQTWNLSELSKSYLERQPVKEPAPDHAAASGDLVVRTSGNEIQIVNRRMPETVYRLDGNIGAVKNVAYSAKGSSVVIVGADGSARFWNLSTCSAEDTKCKPQVLSHGKGVVVNSAQFDSAGGQIVTAASDGMARVWNARTGELKRTLRDHKGFLIRLIREPRPSFVPNVFSFFQSLRINRYHPKVAPMNSAAFSPVDPNFVVTGSNDYTVRIWDVRNSSTVRTLRGHTAKVRFVAFSPKGNYVISASDDRTVRYWKPCPYLPEANSNDVITKTARRRFDGDQKKPKQHYYCQDLAAEPLPEGRPATQQISGLPQP